MNRPVIVISSHVARGSVGNRAAVFALEVRGHPVWAVPTIILPFHPGHGSATRIVPNDGDFSAFLNDLRNSPWIGEAAAVLTGYMASAAQAETVGNFIRELKAGNPKVLHVCDPVMGDAGKLYIPEETATAIRDHLVSNADIATPNCFELAWLTRQIVEDAFSANQAAGLLATKETLVTSAPGMMRGNIGNLLVSDGKAVFAEHRAVANPPNGPGDLTAALYLSHRLSGANIKTALQKTTASVFEIVTGAAKRGADELMLETDAGSIVNPLNLISVRQLSVPQRKDAE